MNGNNMNGNNKSCLNWFFSMLVQAIPEDDLFESTPTAGLIEELSEKPGLEDNTKEKLKTKAKSDIAGYYPVLRMIDSVKQGMGADILKGLIEEKEITTKQFKNSLDLYKIASSVGEQDGHEEEDAIGLFKSIEFPTKVVPGANYQQIEDSKIKAIELSKKYALTGDEKNELLGVLAGAVREGDSVGLDELEKAIKIRIFREKIPEGLVMQSIGEDDIEYVLNIPCGETVALTLGYQWKIARDVRIKLENLRKVMPTESGLFDSIESLIKDKDLNQDDLAEIKGILSKANIIEGFKNSYIYPLILSRPESLFWRIRELLDNRQEGYDEEIKIIIETMKERGTLNQDSEAIIKELEEGNYQGVSKEIKEKICKAAKAEDREKGAIKASILKKLGRKKMEKVGEETNLDILAGCIERLTKVRDIHPDYLKEIDRILGEVDEVSVTLKKENSEIIENLQQSCVFPLLLDQYGVSPEKPEVKTEKGITLDPSLVDWDKFSADRKLRECQIDREFYLGVLIDYARMFITGENCESYQENLRNLENLKEKVNETGISLVKVKKILIEVVAESQKKTGRKSPKELSEKISKILNGEDIDEILSGVYPDSMEKLIDLAVSSEKVKMCNDKIMEADVSIHKGNIQKLKELKKRQNEKEKSLARESLGEILLEQHKFNTGSSSSSSWPKVGEILEQHKTKTGSFGPKDKEIEIKAILATTLTETEEKQIKTILKSSALQFMFRDAYKARQEHKQQRKQQEQAVKIESLLKELKDKRNAEDKVGRKFLYSEAARRLSELYSSQSSDKAATETILNILRKGSEGPGSQTEQKFDFSDFALKAMREGESLEDIKSKIENEKESRRKHMQALIDLAIYTEKRKKGRSGPMSNAVTRHQHNIDELDRFRNKCLEDTEVEEAILQLENIIAIQGEENSNMQIQHSSTISKSEDTSEEDIDAKIHQAIEAEKNKQNESFWPQTWQRHNQNIELLKDYSNDRDRGSNMQVDPFIEAIRFIQGPSFSDTGLEIKKLPEELPTTVLSERELEAYLDKYLAWDKNKVPLTGFAPQKSESNNQSGPTPQGVIQFTADGHKKSELVRLAYDCQIPANTLKQPEETPRINGSTKVQATRTDDNEFKLKAGKEVVKIEISKGGQTEKAEEEQAEESRLKSLAGQSACLYNLATEAIGEEVKKRGKSFPISWRRHDNNKKAIELLFKKLNEEVKSNTEQRDQELQIEALALFVRIKNRQSARGMDLTSTLECLKGEDKNWQNITTALRSDLLRNKCAVEDSLKDHETKLKQAEELREVKTERKIAHQKYDYANKNLENMGLAAAFMSKGQRDELVKIRKDLSKEQCELYGLLETAEREVTGGEQGSALPNLREKIADVKIDTMLLSERIKEKCSLLQYVANRHKKNRAVLSMLKGIEQSEKQKPELQKVLDAIFEKMEQGGLDMLVGIKQKPELQEALDDILKNMDNEEFKLSDQQIACGKGLIDELLEKYVGGAQPEPEQDPLLEKIDSTHRLMNQFATDFLHEKLDGFHVTQKKSTTQGDLNDLIDSHCEASKSIDLLKEYENQLNDDQKKSKAHVKAIGHLRDYLSNQLPQTP